MPNIYCKLPDQNWTFSTNVPEAPVRARPAERSSRDTLKLRVNG
jgi:hypothetical protein